MNPQIAMRNYRQTQVMSAPPLQLVLMAYDAALVGCAHQNLEKTTLAVTTLVKALDMRQGDVAEGLYRLYQYCNDLARQGDFDQAAHILRELASAWVQCLVEQGQPAKAVYAAAA
jgi:flagellar protein FliS